MTKRREFLEIETAGTVATLWLNRPDQRNALNRELCIEMCSALRALEREQSFVAVLIRARGPVFCAGADLTERKQMTEAQIRERRLLAFECYDVLEALSKPCICILEGAAIGAGAEIATACDFAYATQAASFRYPEVAWGTVGATQRLPEIVGKRMAKELLFTGRSVSAQEALHLGLVTRLLPPNDVEQTIDFLLEELRRSPLQALRLAKRCVNARFEVARQAALQTEIDAIDELLATSEWQGRMNEFGAQN